MQSERERIVAAAATVIILNANITNMRSRKIKKKPRWWMSSYNKSRSRYNGTDMLFDIQKEPSNTFLNFCRITPSDFEYLLNKIGPSISRNDTNMRKCIPVQERLAIALRFLASGDSYRSLCYLFKVSKQTISICVDDVCEALVVELKGEIKLSRTEAEWLKIENDFNSTWNFPGAIDGKHVVIQSPYYSGSEYINYHGTFNIVLLPLVDADYNFTFVDCGCQGRISDGGVYRNTELYKKISRNELNLPTSMSLPLRDVPLPYVFVADSAFALTENMLKPYPGLYAKGTKERIFNYRLSRARRIVENVFGILSAVFRVLRKPCLLEPQKVTKIVMTCCLLHNFLRRSKQSRSVYNPPGTFDTENEGELHPGSWRNDPEGLTSLSSLRNIPIRAPLSYTAKAIRDKFADYFVTDGAVAWQNNYD